MAQTVAKNVAGKAASSSAVGSENPMKKITIAKLTLNIGTQKSDDLMKRGLKLLGILGAPYVPVKTVTQRRIPGWGLRPGLAIGCKVTVRKNAEKLLKRLLVAKENTLKVSNFDRSGNVSFGIPEYIDIEGIEYDPELKIMGLEAAVTLERPGYRVKRRRVKSAQVGKRQAVTTEEAIAYIKRLGVEVL